MNMLKGTLRHEGGAAWVESGGVRLPLRPSAPVLNGREVIYGVRPEHVSLAGAADGLPAIVQVVEQTGLDMLTFASLAGTSVCCLLRGRHDVAPGQQIHLRPEAGSIHLFDVLSSERLN
jgi:multiple sugar transport system ATP-binding protein